MPRSADVLGETETRGCATLTLATDSVRRAASAAVRAGTSLPSALDTFFVSTCMHPYPETSYSRLCRMPPLPCPFVLHASRSTHKLRPIKMVFSSIRWTRTASLWSVLCCSAICNVFRAIPAPPSLLYTVESLPTNAFFL